MRRAVCICYLSRVSRVMGHRRVAALYGDASRRSNTHFTFKLAPHNAARPELFRNRLHTLSRGAGLRVPVATLMVERQRNARRFSPIPLDYTSVGDTQTAAEHLLARYWTRVLARYVYGFFRTGCALARSHSATTVRPPLHASMCTTALCVLRAALAAQLQPTAVSARPRAASAGTSGAVSL